MIIMHDTDARDVCELFDLGELRVTPDAVDGGLTNRMWRFSTGRGVFAVKQMNRDYGRADYIDWFDRAFTLEQAACAAGVPMARPVPVAATGRCLGELLSVDGRPITVRVHEWVDGEKLESGVVYPPDVVSRAGATLAQIHGLGMPSDVPASEALRVFGDDQWRRLAERLEREQVECSVEFRGLLPVIAELEAHVVAALADATQLLLSHRDSDQKNFMRTPSGELLLVDWDAAGPVHPRHDLANHALVWAGVHAQEPDRRAARAYLDGYRRGGGSSEPFRPTDLAELVALRLGWLEFNVHRALGEQVRGAADRGVGVAVIRRNVEQVPRFVHSLDAWLAVLEG